MGIDEIYKQIEADIKALVFNLEPKPGDKVVVENGIEYEFKGNGVIDITVPVVIDTHPPLPKKYHGNRQRAVIKALKILPFIWSIKYWTNKHLSFPEPKCFIEVR